MQIDFNSLNLLSSCFNLLVLTSPRLSAFIVSLSIIGIVELTSWLLRLQVLVKFDRGRDENVDEAYEKFKSYRKYIPKPLFHEKSLIVIATKLRELVGKVESSEILFQAPSAYLTSPESEAFFRKAIIRIRSVFAVINKAVARQSLPKL